MNNFVAILWIVGMATLLLGISGFADTRKVDRRIMSEHGMPDPSV